MMFSLEVEIFGLATQRIYQNSGKWWNCEELLCENDFQSVLTTLWCYDYDANTSEAVSNVAKDPKDYHNCSSCVIVC